jgi:SAM-dependent methyltransferase
MGYFARRRRVKLAMGVLALQAVFNLGSRFYEPPITGEESVKPGINELWKGEDVDPLLRILEAEGRDIFEQREQLAALAGPRKGTVVADIGAGSGFLVELFSELVGPEGKVYAVDINPVMMKRVAENAAEKGLTNVEVVVCGERSVDLPANSIDLMFICDTYHHFEYPVSTMESIYEALKPGGQIVLVDFYRIEGVSPEWVFGHVRAGEEVFQAEIEAAGFELINAHYPPFLDQNYVLRFVKK